MQNYTNSSTPGLSIAVGMDVHKKKIALCVYNALTSEIVDERELLHDLPKTLKYFQKLQDRYDRVHACYEASSYGFGLQRALDAQGISCEVVEPSSIPRRPSERIKTDRLDARKWATLYAAGLLTTINLPDEEQEAIRSLREFAISHLPQ